MIQVDEKVLLSLLKLTYESEDLTVWRDVSGEKLVFEAGAAVVTKEVPKGAFFEVHNTQDGASKGALKTCNLATVNKLRDIVADALFGLKKQKQAKTVVDVEITPGTDVSVPDGVEHHGEVSENEMTSMTPVLLKDATRLYQPVKGSSPGSRYFVVGWTDRGTKIAARVSGTALSVRAENVDEEDRVQLQKVCMAYHQDGHMSAHLDVIVPDNAARTVGAILAAVGNVSTPVPVIKKIQGK